MVSETTRGTGRGRPWAKAAMLGALVLACYWPALQGSLLWDDTAHLTSPELRSWAGLARIWFDLDATQQYYPVLHTAFWIEQSIWGDAVLGYHLINVTLHAVAACLLAFVLRRLWRPLASGLDAGDREMPPGAEWLVAALFAVHPVCVESVAWISEQKNTLSLGFYLLAALAYLDFDQSRTRRSYLVALGFFLLALGTKSVTATLPAALLVTLWWRRGTLSWRRDAAPLAPWFAVAIVAGLFTAWVERTVVGAQGAEFGLTLGERLLLAGRVIWFYLGKLVWPADLMFVYPRWNVPAASGWIVYLATALIVAGGLWWLRRRARAPLAGWLFFVGSLFPALGFFNVYPFRFSYVADHFQYLASLGVIATVAGGGVWWIAKMARPWRVAGCVAGTSLVLLLAAQTNRQSRIYRDAETLYRATLARNPEAWMAHNNLAIELAKSPARSGEAAAHYEAALRLRPGDAELHNNLAAVLLALPGRTADAVAHLEQALRLNPAHAEAHSNLGLALAMLPGRESEVLAHYEEAVRLKPRFPGMHCNLANRLATLPGRLADAVAHYEQALQLDPNFAEAHYGLANTLARQPERGAEALAHYETALRINPDYADAHVGLANQLARQPGRSSEAIAHYEAALRIAPGVAGVHLNLANELAKTPGRAEEAITHYQTALGLNPDYVDAHVGLAGELAELPTRRGEAIAHYEHALRIDPTQTEIHYALGILLSFVAGRESDALSHYQAALKLRPDHLAARNNLGVFYARQGRLDDARQEWERVLTLSPDHEDARRNLARLQQLQQASGAAR